MPKVSIIMPAYNAELYINQAIDSILNSTLRDLELLVVNDGSTDRTGDILHDYAKRDPRVRVIDQANSGRPAPPKNLALRQVTGDYVCFLDNDDYFAPEKLALMAEGLDQHPEWCAVFHDLKLVDSAGVGLGTSYLQNANFLTKANSFLTSLGDNWYDCGDDFYVFQSLYYAAFHTQSVMIARHRVPWQTVNFDTQFTICDDTDLWLRIGMMGRIGYLDRILSYYRQHDSNLTRKKIVWAEDAVLVHEQNYRRIESRMRAENKIAYQRKIAQCCRELAYLYSNNRNGKGARRAYVNAAQWAEPLKVVMPIIKTVVKDILNFGKTV